MVVVPEVHPEPQQPQNDKQQAANDEVVVTEVRRTMDSQTGKSPEPPKSKKSGQKQKNKAPEHRSTKPDPSLGAIPKKNLIGSYSDTKPTKTHLKMSSAYFRMLVKLRLK